MKSSIFIVLMGLLVSHASHAQKNYGVGWEQPDGPGRGGPPQRRGDGMVEYLDDLFVSTPQTCNLTHVKIMVTGDNVRVEDLDVLYGNGEMDDISVRERFAENSQSRYARLEAGRRGVRCVDGFSVEARSDYDHDRAAVTMVGLQLQRNGDYSEVILGTAYIREFKRRRDDFRRGRGRGGWDHGPGGRP